MLSIEGFVVDIRHAPLCGNCRREHLVASRAA
jgi:hypothetical protein